MPQINLYKAETMRSPEFISCLAQAYEEIGLARRAVEDFMADSVWNYVGTIRDSTGKVMSIFDFDPDERLRTDDDPGQRWYSDFIKWANNPPKRKLQMRRFRRIEALTIAIAAAHPLLALKFGLCVIED